MKMFLSIGLSFALVACGGGGGGGAVATSAGSASGPAGSPATATPVAASPEGFWEGTASTGVLASLAILENGETWGVYSSGGVIVGALYGNTASNATTLSGTGRDFNIPSRTVGAGSYSGTYTTKGTINVATSSGSTFSGKYDPVYEQPASLATVSGSFSGSGLSGASPVQTVAINISSLGVVSVPGTLGCSASGNATPRPSGKNIFDVTITSVGSSCALGNGTVTKGIAYYEPATRRILVMAMNAAKSDGFVYIGQK